MGYQVFRSATVAAALVLAAAPSFALRTGSLAVNATIAPSAVFGVQFSSQPIVITEADFRRGYVDVVMKSRMHLLMTSTGTKPATPQVTVDLAARDDVFKSVNLASSSAARGDELAKAKAMNGNGHTHVSADVGQGVASQRAAPGEGQTSEFRYRFELAPQASAGSGSYATSISLGIDL